MAACVPSSHGSLDGDPADVSGGADGAGQTAPTVEADDDPFDSDEFREFLRDRRARGGRRAEIGSVSSRPVASPAARRAEDDCQVHPFKPSNTGLRMLPGCADILCQQLHLMLPCPFSDLTRDDRSLCEGQEVLDLRIS